MLRRQLSADQWERDTMQQVAKAALLVVVALGAAEQVRYRWGRAQRTAGRWRADVEHHERDALLRTELRSIAGQLAPVVGARVGRARR